MAIKFTINVAGQRQVIAEIDKLSRDVAKGVKAAVNTSAYAIDRNAKRRLQPWNPPRGGVDTGRLRASIRPFFFQGGLAAEVGTNVKYAPFVEFGTRPHWPPKGALQRWAERHGMESDFLIRRAIAKHGTLAHPFLFPSFEDERPRFLKALSDAIKDQMRRRRG